MAKMGIVDIQTRLVGMTNSQIALLAASTAFNGNLSSGSGLIKRYALDFKKWLDEQDKA